MNVASVTGGCSKLQTEQEAVCLVVKDEDAGRGASLPPRHADVHPAFLMTALPQADLLHAAPCSPTFCFALVLL